MENLRLILKDYGLYITPARLTILEALFRAAPVFDHNDLVALCKEKLDRVTVWRTLHLFYERNMLWKVPTSNGVTRYTFRGIKGKEPPIKHVPKENSHLQLICQDCGKIISVNNVKLSLSGIPAGFAPLYIDTIVNGRCSSCSKKVK
jgi:Fe2+ or Zn2+ uptake regulation protein